MNKLKTASAQNLWLLSIPMFIAYIVGLLILNVGLGDELGIPYQVISSLYTSVFISYILLVHIRTFKEAQRTGIVWTKYVLITLYTIALGLFVYVNTVPTKITTTVNDSPFDKWWYSADQSAYGFPSPFLRFLDNTSQEYGNVIFDFSSLSVNVFLFLFAALSVSGIGLILNAINQKWNTPTKK